MNPTAAKRDAIETTAAEWLARRDRGLTAEEAVAFARWRMADAQHAAAVQELEQVWGALDDLALVKGERAGDVAAASPASIARPPGRAGRRGSTPNWWWPVVAMAAALAIAAGAVVWRRSQPVLEATLRYQTEVGGQKKVALADGSHLQLNTNTAVTVHFTAHERRVVLERGEAFFQVAKDAARPFVVAAGRTETRALGTAFVVRFDEATMEVVVTEGRVKFGTGNDAWAELRAGEVAVVVPSGTAALRIETLGTEELARRLAWQSGYLMFKDTPLHRVVAELNRYHRRRLELKDAGTGEVVLGGQFDIGNVDGFLRMLDPTVHVVVLERDADKIVLGQRRP